MVIYSKLNYKIKKLTKSDGKDIFTYLSKYKFDINMEPEERARRRTSLKNTINNELDVQLHVPIGVYTGSNELIGICFTELYTPNLDVAKISYIHIRDDYVNTDGPKVLFNFLINILYENMNITFSNGLLDKFGEVARVYPKILGISGFDEEFGKKLDKSMKDN